MKLFLQKQAVITTTMTKHIYNVLNVSFTLLKNNKQIYWFIFFFFTNSVCSEYVVRIFPRTHVNGLDQGYSVGFIWGPDYQTENVKGAVPVPISFWGDL